MTIFLRRNQVGSSPIIMPLMKKLISLLVVVAVVGEARDHEDHTHHRSLQKHITLQDKWFFRQDLTYEVVNSTTTTSDTAGSSLLLSFQTSDFITNEMCHVKIYDSETCSILIDDETLKTSGIHFSGKPFG